MAADSLAAELSDYAALARQEAEGLEGLGGFEMSLVDEAENLARQLRERPATPASPKTRGEPSTCAIASRRCSSSA
jgi:hypothetical protein